MHGKILGKLSWAHFLGANTIQMVPKHIGMQHWFTGL